MPPLTTELPGSPERLTSPPRLRYALMGNPNTGKTTLFNRLCGIRAKTANFPGSTVEARIGTASRRDVTHDIIDLPGHYGLHLDRPESDVCRHYLQGEYRSIPQPDAVLIIADATNLARNLVLINEVIQQNLPAVVALNMIDLAQKRGLTIDAEALSQKLGVPVVPICARTGEGVDQLIETMARPQRTEADAAALPPADDVEGTVRWAEALVPKCLGGAEAVGEVDDAFTDRLDAAFTHPVVGLVVFAGVMTGLFWTIFTLATVPMDLIELIFASAGEWVGSVLPAGAVRDLLVGGVIPGIAGTVVFLPQIVLLFFLLSLLEDTGYLARAAFVMDKLLRRFGLPGHAFVPLLSAHACAIPAIMSTRLIPGHRDRLAAILVTPFLSCSARVPVYVLLIGLLFADRPFIAGLAFAGCYVLGAVAALLTSLLFRKTILRGPSTPMLLELPSYKWPSLRSALLTTYDRAMVFLKKAGTVILAICIVLWWLGEYPHSAPPEGATQLRAEAQVIETEQPDEAAALFDRADRLEARHAKSNSYIGRIGRTVQPVFEPLGYDAQLTVGVLSSFLAREVFVSTMAVVVTGAEEDPAEDEQVRSRILNATRADGTPVFTLATAASLLVYYVLAMQCLPTLAVTRRETGSWKWAGLQLVWMSGLAYVLAMIVYHALRWSGVG